MESLSASACSRLCTSVGPAVMFCRTVKGNLVLHLSTPTLITGEATG